MTTISREEYLQAIATSAAEDEEVIPATLARRLFVARPLVATALRRLAKDGLVRIDKNGRVHLTKIGSEIAHRAVLRHCAIERMLTELFGMPWYAVHEEAERLEYVISPAFEQKLLKKLGNDSACPHGNVPMQTAADRRKQGWRPLDEAASGSYRIASVFEEDRQLLEMLDREGIQLDTLITLQSQSLDDIITLGIGEKPVKLEVSAAKKIWVKKA